MTAWKERGAQLMKNEKIEVVNDDRFNGGKALAIPTETAIRTGLLQEPQCKTCRNIFEFPKCCTENLSDCVKVITNCANYDSVKK